MSQFLGHSTIQQTEVYVGKKSSDLRDLAARRIARRAVREATAG